MIETVGEDTIGRNAGMVAGTAAMIVWSAAAIIGSTGSPRTDILIPHQS